ncbi:hypothetical protein HS088_TW09G01344 [Tripterygium wilfordii]|uniref:Enhancer of polycomb-like protein n=1 Tax=Tripterygium wilfordii TaxID=458696 RepID=A0A7J7DAJ5_TRIWF|nr:uncharacterized protein LOC120005094 [Tripterygium wilfordii]XP_038710479.1 uncharacterized protein LOC120005094 [Tripterygium wilfordii]KAF5743278.1 hypothetical protein HS088_TW09G01344 [Tripterygium wilfordii]
MENRIGSSYGTEIPKKPRSLDLKSLYKSKDTKNAQDKSVKQKGIVNHGSDGRKSNKRKKSNGSKSLDEVYSGSVSLGPCESKNSNLGSTKKLKNYSSRISFSLEDRIARIPKRKRDFVGRSKFESSGQPFKLFGQSGNNSGLVDHAQNVNGDDLVDQAEKVSGDDLGNAVESTKVNKIKGYDDFKEDRNIESSSAQNLKKEDGRLDHSFINNGDSSLKKSRKIRRKREVLDLHTKSAAKEAEPIVGTSTNKLQDDEEENLEENAARMLSSRFNPSCTRFSLNSRVSISPPSNGLSFLLSSRQDLVRHGAKYFSGSESASGDTTGRILRPRKEDKENSHSRKRRHYYEIFSRDLDAHWVLKRRIKVFWPLDQSWYYGLVNDYDEERKLHHVKYDDREEEWISLQNERFKLLLLPGEVPSTEERKRSALEGEHADDGTSRLKPSKDKEKRDLAAEDDDYIGGCMDTEPIISWLARSTRRVKSLPSYALKKQKTTGGLSSTSVADEAVGTRLDGGTLNGQKIGLSNGFLLPDRLVNISDTPCCSRDRKFPIVYFRRRFHKMNNVLCHASANSVSGALESVSTPSTVDECKAFGDEMSVRRLDPDDSLLSIENVLSFKLTIPSIECKQLRFEFDFPVLSVMNHSFGAENVWLFRALLLLQYGTVMATWPRVHLETVVLDNVIGLRFLLFEGCLGQALAFVFEVLNMFHQPDKPGKYVDLQLPVTSVRFKFSCIQGLRKHLVFAFYNFSEVKNSTWAFLDCELKRHCLLTRQLPLSECTYDNIKALQDGNQLLSCSTCKDSASFEGSRRRSSNAMKLIGISRESASVNANRCSVLDKKHRFFPPFALCFNATPTFFLSLHLKLLMEHSMTPISFQDHDSDDCSTLEDCFNKCLESPLENILRAPLIEHFCSGCLSGTKSVLGIADLSASSQTKLSSEYHQNNGLDVAGSMSSDNPEQVGNDAIPLEKWQNNSSVKEQYDLSSGPSVDRNKSDNGSHSLLNGITIEIPSFNQFEKHVEQESGCAQQFSDLSWHEKGIVITSANLTAPRSNWHRHRSSSSFGYIAHGWLDGKPDLFRGNFGNGPKKPRTQVSYTLPFGSFEYGSKNKSFPQKGLAHKRIRKASEKRSSDGARALQRNLELLSCDANLLITLGDQGWRECGAQVVLELFDHSEWKLAIKASGATKYSYKAHQFMQPGSTNRFTHAMMWKGGKDWILEFPDRSQWSRFKEMHEECYNRNIRAASVKNIPIPGVRLIEEHDDNGTEVIFFRSLKYYRQVETDIEMALNRSRVLYDMDGDDEQWILKYQISSGTENSGLWKISEEMFEKIMDVFEKAAYVEQCDQFTSDEVEGLMAGVGPMGAIKSIYEHWRQKRQRKEMPLIRHLQPPLWERYQDRVREWELATSKANPTLTNGCMDKIIPIEKPSMFAFCLKPRGLEVPNKGSKHRSQRRISLAGQSNTILDHDGLHSYGQRLNGFYLRDAKFMYSGLNYESLGELPLPQTAPRVFSPRDPNSTGYFSMGRDGIDKVHNPKLQKSKSRKFGMYASPSDSQIMASFGPRGTGKRNGVHPLNLGLSDWPTQQPYHPDLPLRQGLEQLDGSELDEFRLRDASGAAQHARNVAKLKREKARRVHYRADMAIQKAVVALMTAEAIKASSENLNDDGWSD